MIVAGDWNRCEGDLTGVKTLGLLATVKSHELLRTAQSCSNIPQVGRSG